MCRGYVKFVSQITLLSMNQLLYPPNQVQLCWVHPEQSMPGIFHSNPPIHSQNKCRSFGASQNRIVKGFVLQHIQLDALERPDQRRAPRRRSHSSCAPDQRSLSLNFQLVLIAWLFSLKDDNWTKASKCSPFFQNHAEFLQKFVPSIKSYFSGAPNL